MAVVIDNTRPFNYAGTMRRTPGRTPRSLLPTMSDVAERVGVSAMTVSRALRNDASIAPETRARIMRAVEEVGYVLDQSARSLVSRRTDFIAALIPSINNSNFSDTARAITEVLEPAGIQLLLGYTDYSFRERGASRRGDAAPPSRRHDRHRREPYGAQPQASGTGRHPDHRDLGSAGKADRARRGLLKLRGRRALWFTISTGKVIAGSLSSAAPPTGTSAARSAAKAMSAPSMNSACQVPRIISIASVPISMRHGAEAIRSADGAGARRRRGDVHL